MITFIGGFIGGSVVVLILILILVGLTMMLYSIFVVLRKPLRLKKVDESVVKRKPIKHVFYLGFVIFILLCIWIYLYLFSPRPSSLIITPI